HERWVLECLRNDDRQEVRLPARERPHVVEHCILGVAYALQRLDSGPAARELPPAPARIRLRPAVGDPDGVVALARDLARVPGGQLRRRIEAADIEDDLVGRLRRGLDGRGSRLQAPADDSGVGVYAE